MTKSGQVGFRLSPMMIDAYSVATTNVLHTAVISADGHVTTARIAVISVSTMPVPPIAIPVPTDARRTDAELATRQHNRLVGRAQGIPKRRQGCETRRKYQNG